MIYKEEVLADINIRDLIRVQTGDEVSIGVVVDVADSSLSVILADTNNRKRISYDSILSYEILLDGMSFSESVDSEEEYVSETKGLIHSYDIDTERGQIVTDDGVLFSFSADDIDSPFIRAILRELPKDMLVKVSFHSSQIQKERIASRIIGQSENIEDILQEWRSSYYISDKSRSHTIKPDGISYSEYVRTVMKSVPQENPYKKRIQKDYIEDLHYLSESDAKKWAYEPLMVDAPTGEKMNRFDDASLDRIYQLSGGCQYYIDLICSELVDYLIEIGKGCTTLDPKGEFLSRYIKRLKKAGIFLFCIRIKG